MANDFTNDTHCKALWRFENGALTTDSKGGNTLIDNNTVGTNTTSYKEGSACADFERTNSEYFSITDANLDSGYPLKNGDTNKKISVALWFQLEVLVDTDDYFILYSKYNASTGKRSFGITLNDDEKVRLVIGHNNGDSFETAVLNHACVTERWYHLGVTFQNSDKSYRIRLRDSETETVYETTGNTTNNINVEDAQVRIGSVAAGYYHDGEIDEMVVFDDILTADEIDEIYNGQYLETRSIDKYDISSITEDVNAAISAIDMNINVFDQSDIVITLT